MHGLTVSQARGVPREIPAAPSHYPPYAVKIHLLRTRAHPVVRASFFSNSARDRARLARAKKSAVRWRAFFRRMRGAKRCAVCASGSVCGMRARAPLSARAARRAAQKKAPKMHAILNEAINHARLVFSAVEIGRAVRRLLAPRRRCKPGALRTHWRAHAAAAARVNDVRATSIAVRARTFARKKNRIATIDRAASRALREKKSRENASC